MLKKEGVFSLAVDSYFGSNKVGFVLIPDHHGNLIPLNDSELPININGLREGMSINQPEKPYEYGITFQKSFSNLDLTISYFKRMAKIKDTGKILPGHGGLLDRIDGIIFAVPIIYLILEFGGAF